MPQGKKLNILLINHYAGSPQHGMEYRPYYLAREWRRLGHKVQIVASARSHYRARQPDIGDRSRLDEVIDGIRYRWLKTPFYVGNTLGRFRNIASFVCRLSLQAKEIVSSFAPDVVIASSTYPLDIWPAHRIAKKAEASLIFEVHDLWPLSPIELGGMPKWHPFILLLQAAEGYAYRRSNAVVSVLPKVQEYMESRGLSPNKLYIVPNGVDPEEWQTDGPDLDNDLKDFLAKIKGQGKTIIGYAGAHGLANALDALLDAARLMVEEKTVFLLVGSGPSKEALQQRASNEGLRKVIFIDPVDKEKIPALLSWFDIAYIGLKRQPLFRFGIAPNKLMDYMMAGRPVLMAVEAGNDPVSEAGCGLRVKPEDPQAIAKGLRWLMSLSREELEAMGVRGRRFVMANHSYPVLAQRFLECFKTEETSGQDY